QVIKARALLNRNDPVGAAAAAAAVVTAFQYLSTHSVTANDNALWLQNISLRRYTMADGDGGNGLNFKTANDPRIPPGPTSPATSFDAVTPWNSQGIWLNRTDPVIIASGIEARLIEAEAALRANDAATFIAKLNVARATKAGLAPLTDPGTTTARVDLLFRERAFWMFSTGHRLGDLRRMIRQYGRNAETVFPTGIYFKGGPMGTDVNFPIPQAEQNNPSDPQASCTDRLP
ncbi:MAG TPA: RagB/SusD family nutrient uptake outer membrane protein, partial [Gemmatimonadales bacterium]|nr:RagB/SusD family nutrient uptake outer membrane protein [Gemmatimonadales bacterium]